MCDQRVRGGRSEVRCQAQGVMGELYGMTLTLAATVGRANGACQTSFVRGVVVPSPSTAAFVDAASSTVVVVARPERAANAPNVRARFRVIGDFPTSVCQRCANAEVCGTSAFARFRHPL